MTQSAPFSSPRAGLDSGQTWEGNPFTYTLPLRDGRAPPSFSYTTPPYVFLLDSRDCDLKLFLLIHPLGAFLVAANSYTLGRSCGAGPITG